MFVPLTVSVGNMIIRCVYLAIHYQTGQPLNLCLLYIAEIYPYYAGNFSYYVSIMLYAFQPLLYLKLCWHNQRRPSFDRL